MFGLRILIVDEHEGSRRALATLLRYSGHEVVAEPTWDAVRARSSLAAPFDLALSEVSLPGRAEFGRMAQLAAADHTAGILVTAHAADAVKGWRRAGFSRCLHKPIEFAHLMSEIDALMRDSHASEVNERTVLYAARKESL